MLHAHMKAPSQPRAAQHTRRRHMMVQRQHWTPVYMQHSRHLSSMLLGCDVQCTEHLLPLLSLQLPFLACPSLLLGPGSALRGVRDVWDVAGAADVAESWTAASSSREVAAPYASPCRPGPAPSSSRSSSEIMACPTSA